MKVLTIKSDVDILTFEYPHHQDLKEELYSTLLNYPDVQDHSTNVKATMTEMDLDSPEISKLKAYYEKMVNLRCKCGHGLVGWPNFAYDNPIQPKVVTFWANIYRKGDYTNSHAHWPEHFSFVYFLHTKRSDAPLVFNKNKPKIIPKEGTGVMFPSYVQHGVPEQKVDGERITLSADVKLV